MCTDIFGIVLLVYLAVFSECRMCHQEEVTNAFTELSHEFEMVIKVKEMCKDTESANHTESGVYCDQIFDGLMCWPQTTAGTISIQPCPDYMYNVVKNGNASRICLPDGEWYINPEFNTTWTNLSGCYDTTGGKGSTILVPAIVEKHLRYIQLLYDVGYGISLVALVIAVSLMICLRNIHCQRNTIHINMFVSFICRSVICFIKDIYVVPEIDQVYVDVNNIEIPFDKTKGCKIVYTLFYYIISTNFMWIFVEGIYMHTFVQSTRFCVSPGLYRTLLAVGWLGPSTFVIPWVIVRLKYENTLCWSTHDVDNGYYWIIKGPIIVTVVINFIFFVNIIRVLYTKLTANNHGKTKRYRKLTKSTLILIPLFGVYYIAFIAVPVCMKPVLEVIWMYTEMFFNSFQGFAVAVLFCFLNEEVRREVKRFKRAHKMHRNSYTSNRSRTKSLTGYLYHSEHEAHTDSNRESLQLAETSNFLHN